ncbi:MAG: hypothetical protein JRI47_10110 [Deltaproteobacteria bacterium]|nr:hypothetical protein [Deltaproteobacteria bacterium]MBW1897392.1 hypothetical protein [Deltaproteobacteria bacterium]
MFQDQKDVETILSALGEQLKALAAEPLELLVCGGSALNVLGLVQRATKDVDILAYVKRNNAGDIYFIKAEPLSTELVTASRKVARDFNLPENWINAGPTSAVDFGLPDGIMERVTTREFGPKLTVHFLGRYDQIHFKLYAAADQGAGKHFDDLLALNPAADELEQAARWSMTHDVSKQYRQILKELLNHIGHGDVAEKL